MKTYNRGENMISKDSFKNLTHKVQENIFSGSFWAIAGFLLLLCVSWLYLSRPSLDSEEEQAHSLLQNQFQTLLSDFVIKKHPEVTSITFHKVWTKGDTQSQEVEIFFNYSLKTEGPAGGELLAEGTALLKESAEKPGLWLVENFRVTDSFLSFSEPLLIRAKPSE